MIKIHLLKHLLIWVHYFLFKGCDNHILYGRRGTGKTHILSYLCTLLEKQYDCPIYIDLRILGSTNSIYTNNQLPIEQRVTRLVIDIFRKFMTK